MRLCSDIPGGLASTSTTSTSTQISTGWIIFIIITIITTGSVPQGNRTNKHENSKHNIDNNDRPKKSAGEDTPSEECNMRPTTYLSKTGMPQLPEANNKKNSRKKNRKCDNLAHILKPVQLVNGYRIQVHCLAKISFLQAWQKSVFACCAVHYYEYHHL